MNSHDERIGENHRNVGAVDDCQIHRRVVERRIQDGVFEIVEVEFLLNQLSRLLNRDGFGHVIERNG